MMRDGFCGEFGEGGCGENNVLGVEKGFDFPVPTGW